MIYPTLRAVVLAAAGAPAALVIAVAAPAAWPGAGAWLALIGALILLDAVIGPAREDGDLTLEAPAVLGVGTAAAMQLEPVFEGPAPTTVEIAVGTNARLAARPDRISWKRGGDPARVELIAGRRGEGTIERLWLRWRGPLGLVWKQASRPGEHRITVLPDVAAVKREAVRLFSRQAVHGVKTQLDVGEGSEFHALRELIAGMDVRAIDWKQSARHGKLLAKEFRVERNHPVVFAIDTGRLMSEPLARGGPPKVDVAINAALALAYVSLKLGDLAGVFGFDARPREFSGLHAGVAAFPRIQRRMTALDYSPDETNYTLGLTELSRRLQRRTLVVVFTDFADSTSAELMVENLGRLLRRHLVLFVLLADEPLEALVAAEPASADDVSRAVIAAALIRDREIVAERLRRRGVHVLEAPAAGLAAALISAYLDVRRRER
ncbi:MAG: DUF58 domain-containing protein [Caulobacteraceae bacterium]